MSSAFKQLYEIGPRWAPPDIVKYLLVFCFWFFRDGITCQRNQECNVKDLDVNFGVAVISSNALAVDGVKSGTIDIHVFDIRK